MEAEDGYELDGLASEPNPHSQRLQLVPSDLLDAIDRKAEKEGTPSEDVIRRALSASLNSA